jgi:single-strand DNA-binding protein
MSVQEVVMVNKGVILGRVGGQPDIRNFSNGGRGASFSVATSESWTDKKTGEKREAVEWHRVSVFGGLVDVVERYVDKGTMLYIEGKIKTRNYTHNGQDKTVTEIVLDGFGSILKLVGNKPSTSQQSQSQQAAGRQQSDYYEADAPF